MRVIYFLAILILPAACKKSAAGSAGTNEPTAPLTLTDVSYGSDSRQTMDIYLPADRTASSTKVFFLIHGGGWREGDKADFTGAVASFRASLADFAFVNINYRLFTNNQNLFPTQENDVRSAAAFVFGKRKEYGLSDKWAFMGASAGGHLALLQSYKYNSPVMPKAVVSFFGPTDLISLYNTNSAVQTALQEVTGTTPSADSAVYQQSSPLYFVSAQSPPTLLLQGGADPLVPQAQAAMLADALQKLGIANQYVLYPGNGHGWNGPDLQDSFTKIVAFLKLHVN